MSTPPAPVLVPQTSNLLEALLHEGELDFPAPEQNEGHGRSRAVSSDRFQSAMRAARTHLNQPGMEVTKSYLEGIHELSRQVGAPARAVIQEIGTETEEHGYYNPSDQEISLGIQTPEAAAESYAQGYGGRGEQLAGTAVHEYTHVLDLEPGMAAGKPYRAQALASLQGALPHPREFGDEARIDGARQVGGLLDPHIDSTLGQGILRRGSNVPLMSELMANFAEIAASPDPTAHFLQREAVHQREDETADDHRNRITADYNLLMQHAIHPYAMGLANDPTMPHGVRQFYLNALMRMPASGAELHQAITQRQIEVMQSPEVLRVMAEQAPDPATAALAQRLRQNALRQRLRSKIREKREQRRKK